MEAEGGAAGGDFSWEARDAGSSPAGPKNIVSEAFACAAALLQNYGWGMVLLCVIAYNLRPMIYGMIAAAEHRRSMDFANDPDRRRVLDDDMRRVRLQQLQASQDAARKKRERELEKKRERDAELAAARQAEQERDARFTTGGGDGSGPRRRPRRGGGGGGGAGLRPCGTRGLTSPRTRTASALGGRTRGIRSAATPGTGDTGRSEFGRPRADEAKGDPHRIPRPPLSRAPGSGGLCCRGAVGERRARDGQNQGRG